MGFALPTTTIHYLHFSPVILHIYDFSFTAIQKLQTRPSSLSLSHARTVTQSEKSMGAANKTLLLILLIFSDIFIWESISEGVTKEEAKQLRDEVTQLSISDFIFISAISEIVGLISAKRS